MEEIIVRKCCKCKLEKPLHEFNKNKTKYLGICYECKECNNKYNKEYRKSGKNKKCKSYIRRKQYSREYYIANREYEIWRHAKKRAKLNNLEFSIEIDDIIVPSICPVLGIPIIGDKGRCDNSPSLDRIDNTKGYTKDNICVISWRANNIKHVGTAEEHRKIAEYIEKHTQQ